MTALPWYSQREYLLSLQIVVFTAQRKNSGGFNVEFSVGGGTVVFPLFPEKGQSRFPLWHWWHIIFRFSRGAQPKPHVAPGSGHLWCWQQLGTQTSVPVKNRLCWNCPISRGTWQCIVWVFPVFATGETRELRLCVGRSSAGVRGHQWRGVLLLHSREHRGWQRIRHRPAARQPLQRRLLTKVSLWSRRSRP